MVIDKDGRQISDLLDEDDAVSMRDSLNLAAYSGGELLLSILEDGDYLYD